ncbi:MAG: rod shape-determining protein MreC [Syntrophales bacterium]|jgi:rod shape-determining protein MreC|nr:rod shape-determining protein MreC [Syntrophales bacterium]MCK9390581.1 rod shape-determining protein MreC [Syntrophales bacterium]
MSIPKKYRPTAIVILVIVFSIILLILSTRIPSDTGFMRKLILDVAAPIERLIRMPLDKTITVWNRYLFLVGLGEENRRLKRDNDQLKNQLLRYQEGYIEGLRLQKLLTLKEQTGYVSMTARVIGIDQKALIKTILINKGASHGIRNGLPVMNEQGVLGRIIETSWHVSRVLLISDGNSNIDALVQGTRVQGMLQGSGTMRCVLKYIAKTEEVKAGDLVVSSGMTEIFPKGLLLGTVIRADKKDSGLFQRIEVVPAVDFTRLEEVLVLMVVEKKKK